MVEKSKNGRALKAKPIKKASQTKIAVKKPKKRISYSGSDSDHPFAMDLTTTDSDESLNKAPKAVKTKVKHN